MNVATKSAVVLSTLTAAWLLGWFGAAGFAPLLTAALVAFAVSLAAASVSAGVVTRAVLFAVYLSPAAFLVWTGRNHFTFEVVWISALLGLMTSGRDAWRWHLPSPWRWPLMLWALVVSVSWPIVLGREFDFSPWIAGLPRVSNTSIGIGPSEVGTWTLYVVLTHNVGLLWIDWLYRRYRNDPEGSFRGDVLRPLAAAVLVSCLVGVYQALVDIHFLSGHLWPHMGRAAGTLMDANAFGLVAGLWGPALVALTVPLGGHRAILVGVSLLAISVLGVWASGSRTALVALAAGVVGVAVHGWFVWRSADRTSLASRTNVVIAGGLLLVMVAVGAVMLQTPGITAFERARHLIPGLESTLGESVWLLWDRMGYGSAAMLMIEEHPWVGVGVGGYHTLVHDFAAAAGGYDLPPDNAQNWFRHHLAELGLLGSVPWIIWTLLFARALVTPSRGDDSATPRLLRAALIGFGLLSLVGMPGQSPAVAVTFWTFAFWYLTAAAPDEPPSSSTDHPGLTRAAWTLMLVIVAAHAVGTYAVAHAELRPAERAVRFGWYYRYGIYDLERPPDGTPFRWTMRRSVAVIPVEGRVLAFDASVDHPDADQSPVDVRVWADGELVAAASLRRGERIRADIPASPGRYHLILRTEVDRAWTPEDHGGSDPRELGLAIADWRWVP